MMQRIAAPLLIMALLVGVAAVILLLRDGGEPALVAATDRCIESEGDIGSVKRAAPGGIHLMTTTGSIQDRYLGLGGLGSFSWSPDGNGLAYVVDRELPNAESNFLPANPNQFIPSLPYVQAIDVRDGVSLLPPRPGGTPYWSPNGRWLAFQALSVEGEEELVCLASLEDPSQVETIAMGYELARTDAHLPMQRPAWSPDGTRLLLFDSMRLPHILDVSSGTSPVPLWDQPVSGTNWSPDGSQVAVTSAAGSDLGDLPAIWIINADAVGGNAAQIGRGRQPIWTPDGENIVTFLHPEQTIEIIYVATGELVRIVDGALPALSPDGKQLAYVTRWSFGGEPVNIFVLDLTTDQTTQLTDFESSFIETPSWSPDGSKIAFYAGGTDVQGGLYRVLPEFPDSFNYVRYADGAHVWRPVWSPDSNHIVFSLGGGHD